MPCPYYRNGVCMSPLHLEPRPDLVREEVCEGPEEVYTRCRYFVKPGERGLEAFQPSAGLEEKPYPLLHLLERKVESTCPEYTLRRYEGSYVAYCRVLDRLLTKYEVENCEKYPDTCPLRKYAVSTSLSQ